MPATEFAPCRHLTQPWQCDSQKHATRHVSSAAPTQNDDGHVRSAAPATKTATHLAKTSQKYCACHTKRLSTRYKTRLNVTKCHALPRETKQRDVWNLQKRSLFCRTFITRTVANGCGRLRTVADGSATSSEHTLNSQAPRVKQEPLLRIREKSRFCGVKKVINWGG